MALPHKTKTSATEPTETAVSLPKIGSLYKWVTCLQEMRYKGQSKQSGGTVLNFTYTVSCTKQGDTLTLTPYQLEEALRLGRLIKIQ
jgi:hypothetical protein